MHEASKQQFELMPAPLGERVDACCCVLLYAFVTFLHSSRCLHLASEEEWRSIGETPPVHALRVMVVLPGSFPTCYSRAQGLCVHDQSARERSCWRAISLHHRRTVLESLAHRIVALHLRQPYPTRLACQTRGDPLVAVRAHSWSTRSLLHPTLRCCKHPPKQPTRWWMSLGPSAHSITWCARCCCPDATRHAGVARLRRRSPLTLTPPY